MVLQVWPCLRAKKNVPFHRGFHTDECKAAASWKKVLILILALLSLINEDLHDKLMDDTVRTFTP
jgi:hypothetical protein